MAIAKEGEWGEENVGEEQKDMEGRLANVEEEKAMNVGKGQDTKDYRNAQEEVDKGAMKTSLRIEEEDGMNAEAAQLTQKQQGMGGIFKKEIRTTKITETKEGAEEGTCPIPASAETVEIAVRVKIGSNRVPSESTLRS